MVLDTLKNMSLYEGLGENFKQVAEYVKVTDLRSLEIAGGKYEVHRK